MSERKQKRPTVCAIKRGAGESLKWYTIQAWKLGLLMSSESASVEDELPTDFYTKHCTEVRPSSTVHDVADDATLADVQFLQNMESGKLTIRHRGKVFVYNGTLLKDAANKLKKEGVTLSPQSLLDSVAGFARAETDDLSHAVSNPETYKEVWDSLDV